MKKQSLGIAFKSLRLSNGLTMLDAGMKCELAESTIWKIEWDKPVRWETVHIVLTVALNVQPGSSEYQNFHLLWLKKRQEIAESQTEGLSQKKVLPHVSTATDKFRKIIRDLPKEHVDKVLNAAIRASKSLKPL